VSDVTSLLQRCAEFVYDEADLLDEGRFEDWLELFAEDGVYWVPIDTRRTEPRRGLNLVFDDRARLCDRVGRLQSGFSHTEEPISRTSHVVGNLRLLSAERAAALVGWFPVGAADAIVSGRLVVARLRPGAPDLFHGRVTYVLRPAGDSFTIAVKRVDLIDADQPLPAMTFLL
jgi:benzoate/toluate 1,2-dioxygenase subunit beta